MKNNKVIVDFTEYPELLEKLKEWAIKDCRTPGFELLSLLKDIVENRYYWNG